jgi:hypothetical protein
MPYADHEKQKAYCRQYQKIQRELLKKLKRPKEMSHSHPMRKMRGD